MTFSSSSASSSSLHDPWTNSTSHGNSNQTNTTTTTNQSLQLSNPISFNSLETDHRHSIRLPTPNSATTTIQSTSTQSNSTSHPLTLNISNNSSSSSASSSSIQTNLIHQLPYEDSITKNLQPSSPDLMDATRPTLKRLTRTDQSSNPSQSQPSRNATGMWFGSFKDRSTSNLHPRTRHSTHRASSSQSKPSNDLLDLDEPQLIQHSDQLDKGKGKATPLADNLNRIKGAKDVLIHSVEKHDTIAGIALSYGISLSALRKANGMWASDPLSLKDTLRIPLELCNLPPSKKIEIEEDSGKVLIWEQSPSSSRSSSPRLMHHRKSNSQVGTNSWINQSGITSNPSRQVSSNQWFFNHQQQNGSRISLEMSASVGTSSEAGLSPNRTSFDKLSAFGKPTNSLENQDEVSNYLTGTNFAYPISELPSPPPPLDEGIPHARNPGVLTSISNTISPPSQSGSHISNGQPKVIATLERVPAHELGFFTSNANSPNPRKSYDPSGSSEQDSTTLLSNQPLNNLALNLTPNLPAHSTLRQRSATTNNRSAQVPNHLSSPARHNTTPDPMIRPTTTHRTSSNTLTQIHNSPRKQVGRLQLDYETSSIDPSQISPGLEKKRAAAQLFQVRGALPSVSNRGGLTGIDGAYPQAESHPRNRSSNESNGYPNVSGAHNLASSSKWTTVRPGVPPPLDKRLKFLEEGTSTKFGTILNGFLNLEPLVSSSSSSSVSNHQSKPNHKERLELNEILWSESDEPITLQSNSQNHQRNKGLKKSKSGLGWGFWNDLLDEASQASRK
ncbi:uncharacterized protein MELLADRAFT_77569 [Melampsora larici-populina 98AG31]|uniref:LysM domain-containing protein n=1 Tax=Melampsora larici-populina (strain 98AG31 / pathotype 3-4-7) TaxID=747676 RepID=F4RJE7_MELLP|nr:uncharacterized protein MELLADRAFT_77569 [Melampsora larici-populina 98AG31]EGG07300.1 hypothetical protein MELLADRAFT_77569 [Melampsora larici-populina 98AG31]